MELKSSDLVLDDFVGRSAEIGVIMDCVREVGAETSWLVLIQGEPGIGKTALMRRVAEHLDDFTILRASCDEAERELPYGVLTQLTSQVPQAQLTKRQSQIPPSGSLPPFTAGGHLLELLGGLQRTRPVAVLIDDIPLADGNSLAALRYAQRRMLADRVLVVVTARTGQWGTLTTERAEREGWRSLAAATDRVCSVELAGLTAPDVTVLAAQLRIGRLSLPAADRLCRYTNGNPLHVRAVLSDVSAHELEQPDTVIPVVSSLRTSVQRRLARLPAESRLLLEALSVIGTRTPLAVAGQVAGVIEPTDALEPMLESGLVSWSPADAVTPIWINHPMNRDAIEANLSPIRRRELHARAADFVPENAALRHRVAASSRMNEPLAAELEHRAFGQLRLGNTEQAATWLEWASDLSADRSDHERRLLTAATLVLFASRSEHRAERLKARIESCKPTSLRSATLGRMKLNTDLPGSESLLREAIADALRTPGQGLALGAAAMWLGGTLNNIGRGAEAVAAVEPALGPAVDPTVRMYAQLIRYAGLGLSAGPRSALRLLDKEEELPAVGAVIPDDKVLLISIRGSLSALAGDLNDGVQDLQASLRQSLAGVGGDCVETTSHFLVLTEYLLGQWMEATIHAETTLATNLVEGRDYGRSRPYMDACLLAAGRGEWEEAVDNLRQTQRWAASGGVPQPNAFASMASAGLAQARGEYAGMLVLKPHAHWPLSGLALAYQAIWLPWYVEGLLGSGRLDDAAAALDRLQDLQVEVPNLRCAIAWLSAWYSAERGDIDRAKVTYDAALRAPGGPDDPPLHRAALAHGYGRLLMSQAENRAAAVVLTEAASLYAAMGARPFLDRVSADLAKTGAVPASRKMPDPQLDLTGRERQIAVLVARGLSNDQVAHELYLSTKTVEYHLSHVYSKLGVSGRRDLRSLFGHGIAHEAAPPEAPTGNRPQHVPG